MPSGFDGVDITDGIGNIIGGTAAGDRNVLSGNVVRGVGIDAPSSKNVIEGNDIGTDAFGISALCDGLGLVNAQERSGILIAKNASNNTIGGTSSAARNAISGNGYDGVHIDSSSHGNVVEGNDIGTNAAGTGALGNHRNGVEIDGGSASNVVGGTAAGAGNTIADNYQNGDELNGAGASNLVEDDLILGNGSNPLGTTNIGEDGVDLIDASSTTVVTGCTIESNDGWGIFLSSSPSAKTSGNTIPSAGSLANELGTIGSSS